MNSQLIDSVAARWARLGAMLNLQARAPDAGWMADFELKDNAIRPEEWVAEHNPTLYERALTGGDLIASVLVECELDPAIVESHAELARRCGASRPAIRDAIRRLRLVGRIRAIDRGKAKAIELRRQRVA